LLLGQKFNEPDFPCLMGLECVVVIMDLFRLIKAPSDSKGLCKPTPYLAK